jgi:hypothetical protein
LIDRFNAVTLFPDALVLQGLVGGGKDDETLRLVRVRDPGLKKVELLYLGTFDMDKI